MKVAYKLKRICGSVYNNGNIIFTKDGNSVLSPVGNQINVFNLVDQSSKTLNFENRKNIARTTLSHNGLFLISVDTEGHALLINYPKQIILSRFHFKRRVYDIKFSPDDTLFAVTFGHGVQIWKTPSIQREFVPLILKRTLGGHYDDTTCLNWSSDSNSLIIGSKDLSVRIYHRVKSKKMVLHVLSGHRDKIIGVFFASNNNSNMLSEENEMVYTLAKDGALFTWKFEYNDEIFENVLNSRNYKKMPTDNDDESNHSDEYSSSDEDEDDEDETEEDGEEEEDYEEEEENNNKSKKYMKSTISKSKTAITNGRWVLHSREFLWDNSCRVTSAAYQDNTKLLVIGFNNGVFGLYEMPDCISLQRLSISNSSITTASISPSGEWIVLGAANLSQLLVWEWKSESYILKQQGHLYGMNALDFSLDGMYIATAGEDSKVKLWSTVSGFCIITLSEHIAPVTGVKFIGKGTGKALLSCSLDGTVRAHDLLRYKNFRTLTTSTPMQFTSLACDSGGEVVCAGTLDPFQIYVWSLQSGHLLEVLAGHEGPLACLDFSPTGGTLASSSWDGTLKIWDIYKNECMDTLEHGCDVLCIAFRPDGKEIVTCATNGIIYIWDVETGSQLQAIEGQKDLGAGRLTTDARTSASSAQTKHFKTVAYSPDGNCILAGGHSKYVCLYSAITGVLLKKFELSHNQSLEGLNRILRSDQVVDGVALSNLRSQQKLEEDGIDVEETYVGSSKVNKDNATSAELPGTNRNRNRAGDDGSRTVKPVFMTSALRFSLSGREWGAATTEGLQVFGLDDELIFAPEDLSVEATPQAVYTAIKNKNHGLAVTLALQLSLSEFKVLEAAIESTPMNNIEIVVKTIHPNRFKDLFKFLTQQILSSKYIEYYLHWSWQLLRLYGPSLQRDVSASLALQECLRSLLRAITQHEKESLKYAEQNLFLLNFLSDQVTTATSTPTTHDNNENDVISPSEHMIDESTNTIYENDQLKSSLLEFSNIQQYIKDHKLNVTDVSNLHTSFTENDEYNSDNHIDDHDDDIIDNNNHKKSKNYKKDIVVNNNKQSENIDEIDDNDVWTSNWVDDDNAADIEVEDQDPANSNSNNSSRLLNQNSSNLSSTNDRTSMTFSHQSSNHYERMNGYSVEVVDVRSVLLAQAKNQ